MNSKSPLAPYLNLYRMNRPSSQHSHQGRPPRQEKRIDELIKRSQAIINYSKQMSNPNLDRAADISVTRGRGLPPLSQAHEYRGMQSREDRNDGNYSVHSQRDYSTEDPKKKYVNYVRRNLSEKGQTLNTSIDSNQNDGDEVQQQYYGKYNFQRRRTDNTPPP